MALSNMMNNYIHRQLKNLAKLFALILINLFLLRLLLVKFKIFQVSGMSMYPTLKPGDIVISSKSSNLKPGNIAIFKETGSDLLAIKRVAYISSTGKMWLEGDNPEFSYDSRSYGEVDLNNNCYKACVVLRRQGLRINWVFL
jgi:signal peptidase I